MLPGSALNLTPTKCSEDRLRGRYSPLRRPKLRWGRLRISNIPATVRRERFGHSHPRVDCQCLGARPCPKIYALLLATEIILHRNVCNRTITQHKNICYICIRSPQRKTHTHSSPHKTLSPKSPVKCAAQCTSLPLGLELFHTHFRAWSRRRQVT